jgi:hypothetical protein
VEYKDPENPGNPVFQNGNGRKGVPVEEKVNFPNLNLLI